jgi:hypothetical protein
MRAYIYHWSQVRMEEDVAIVVDRERVPIDSELKF